MTHVLCQSCRDAIAASCDRLAELKEQGCRCTPGCLCAGACGHFLSSVKAYDEICMVAYEAHRLVVALMVLVNVEGVEAARPAMNQAAKAFAPIAHRLKCSPLCRVHEMAAATK